MANKVAVVTGANKGIGYSIVRELCLRGVGVVYLTARDETRGKNAIEKLKKEGLKPEYHQLEVTDAESVKKFAQYAKAKHGGIDILINNAGVMVSNYVETTYEDSKWVIDVNYRSFQNVEDFLYPILKDNARVVNVSSDCGHISNITNPDWIKRLTSDDIKRSDVDAFVDWFLDSVKTGKLNKDDFAAMPVLAYRISKVALCALTRVQQKEIGRGISIHSMHPGFVQTDMTKGTGMLTGEESGEAVVYVALDVDQSVKGKYFWFDKTEKDWADSSLELRPLLDEYTKDMLNK